MKGILFLLVTVPCYLLHGQQTAPHNIAIGFNFSPDYSYRSLINKEGSSSGDVIKKVRNDMEVAKFGYTTGLNICFTVSRLIALETGIQYSSKGYKTKEYDLNFPQPDPAAPETARSIYSYHYIGIPLRVKYSAGKGKVRFLSSAGFTTNFLLNANQAYIYKYADGRTNKQTQSATAGFNKIDISPMISAGIDCTLNNKIRLVAEPTFRCGIIHTKDTPLTENLWSFGLNVGIYYWLK